MTRFALAFAPLLLIAGAVQAQSASPQAAPPAPPPSCVGPEFRALDFWAGDWDLDFDVSPGVIGHAGNHITKDEYGSCVIAEHFTLPATQYLGGSYSIYDPRAKLWRQTWVDNQGGVFVLTGGPVQGQPHVFELRTTEPVGPKHTTMRMIWERANADRLTWRWQAQQADGSWKDSWVLRYNRHKA